MYSRSSRQVERKRRSTLSRAGYALLLPLLTAVMSLTGACDKPKQRPEKQPAAADETESAGRADLNVILISMDTTRADHLACYGHSFIKTPNIDRMAAEGTAFLQCTSSIPITLPSHSTMMTGVHPFVHGARDNGAYRLHPDNITLAEVFKEAGYATAAETAAFVLNSEFGLNQGFDTYDDLYGLVQRVDDSKRFLQSRKAEEICDSAIDLLHKHVDERFFFFLHFFDPHQPYEPPERFASQYPELYVGEIAYVDEQLGRLFSTIKELGLDRKTLVILTSDHGEGRMDHGEETHATYIYDSTVTVPLIFRCPDVIPAGQRITAQVRLVDIAPTILDITGLDPLPNAQGESLLPLVSGKTKDLMLAAYSESQYGRLSYGFAPLWAWRRGGWKYIQAPRPELYHVSVDPGELHNLAEAEPGQAARMREELRKFIEDAPQVVGAGGSGMAVSPESLDKLRALGYVGGETDTASENDRSNELKLFGAGGYDPKDYVELVALTAQTIGAVRMDHPDSEKLLRECIERAPDPDAGFTWAYRDLANLLISQERYDEAIEWLQRAMKADPNDGRTLTALGAALTKAGRLDEAIEIHKMALQIEPVLAQTHWAYGVALAAKRESEEAIKQLRAALAIDPNLSHAHHLLGKVLARNNKLAEGVKEYQAALALVPDNADWRRELVSLLTLQDRPEAILEQYQELIKANPDDASTHAGLAETYNALGRPGEAIESFRRAIELDPKSVFSYDALSALLLGQGKLAEAAELLRRGLEIAPEQPNMANNLAWTLATAPDDSMRDGTEAVKLARMACRVTENENPEYLDTLAAAYAEAENFEEAVRTANQAIELARQQDADDLADRLAERAALYEQGKPLRAAQP